MGRRRAKGAGRPRQKEQGIGRRITDSEYLKEDVKFSVGSPWDDVKPLEEAQKVAQEVDQIGNGIKEVEESLDGLYSGAERDALGNDDTRGLRRPEEGGEADSAGVGSGSGQLGDPEAEGALVKELVYSDEDPAADPTEVAIAKANAARYGKKRRAK